MSTFVLPPGLAELEQDPNWVNWQAEARAGDPKPTKIPYTPSLDGERRKAKAGIPATWGPLATAQAAAEAGRFTGIGYEFHAGEGKFFIDMDKVIDPETRRIAPIARAAMALACTYVEPSPSGTGIHIVGKGNLPRPEIAEDRQGKKAGGHELYGGAHFATMTFRPFKGYETLRDVDDETMRLLFHLLFPRAAGLAEERPAPLAPLAPVTTDDAALLEKAFAAKGGTDFYQRHKGQYLLENKSEDDFGYLGTLRFWTQGDAARMRHIALTSGRVRDKWHGRRGAGDWLDYTIAKSCAEPHEVYDPGRLSGVRLVVPEVRVVGEDGEVVYAPPDAELLAEKDATIARLADRLNRRDEQLAHCRQEHQRKDGVIVTLQTEVAAYKAAMAHTDQTIGGCVFDLAHELVAARQRGDVLVQGGKELTRVSYKRAANLRSATTNSKAVHKLDDSGHVPVIFRDEQIETATFKGPVSVAYIEVPPEICESPERVALYLLPPCVEKRHGGARRHIEVPPEVAAQDHPVKRTRELIERFTSLVDDASLGVKVTNLGADYWAANGEAHTVAEAEAFQVSIGARPASTVPTRVPTWRPVQRPLSEADADLFVREPVDLDNLPAPIPLHSSRCLQPECGRLPGPDGFCRNHRAFAAMTMAGAD